MGAFLKMAYISLLGNNQRKVNDCAADRDTVCECVTGFYCSDDQCEHCRPVHHCPKGEGVKVRGRLPL